MGADLSNSFPCQHELLLLLDELPDTMFCIKDRQHRYLDVNDAFLRRSGKRSKREIIGKRAEDLFGPERALTYEEQDRKVFESGQALRDILELLRRPSGGVGWYLSSKIPVHKHSALIGLLSISRDLKTASKEKVAVESLTALVHHLYNHLHESIKVSQMASIAQCSESQLSGRMKRVFGLSPQQYLLRMRVDAAVELLREGKLSLVAISKATGFYDQADFSKHFARMTGQTPAQFRKTRDLSLL